MYESKNSSDKVKKPIRVGLVGHQFMGVAHSNAFRNAAIWHDLPCQVEMKAVCAKDTKENLAAFARKFGWESYETNWRKLVARDDIDLISIAAPGTLHKEISLEVARQGKAILCEKPLANSLADAEEMLAAVEKANVRTCCGFSYRCTPAQALAKQLVDEGRVGRIYHVHARYAQDWPSDPGFPRVWRFDKSVAGSGSLGDICAHSIDAARFITGLEFSEVVGQLATMIHERPINASDPNGEQASVTVDDVAQFIGTLSNGATACFEATRLAIGRKNNNCIEINGELGSLYWDFEEQNYLYFYDKTRPVAEQGFVKINATHDTHPYGGGPWPQGHGIGYADTFVIEIANFLRAMANDEPFRPDFADGVACQHVLDAVERSANERQWIKLNGAP
jgi:predicted dehydrogenase